MDNNLKLLIPGAVQGVTRSLISYPFEVIKTQMQINNNTFLTTAKNIYKTDIRKFYRGITVPLMTIPLERSLQFYIYEKNKKNENIFYNSFMTSFITNSIFTPLSILNVQVINTNKNNFKNTFSFIKSQNLEKLFYRGIWLEISKNYLSTFTYFYIYSTSLKKIPTENLYVKSFFSGIISSIGVWLIVLPLDTYKIRYQVSNKSLLNCFYDLKGVNLWRGLMPIIIRTCPSSGIGMLAYESTKKMLNINN